MTGVYFTVVNFDCFGPLQTPLEKCELLDTTVESDRSFGSCNLSTPANQTIFIIIFEKPIFILNKILSNEHEWG